MTEIDERAKDIWIESTTSRERVQSVLEQTTEPTKASELAERALVSEPTTRKYLRELVDTGVATTEQAGRTTLYKRDEGRVIDQQIANLRKSHSRHELVELVQTLSHTLGEFRETYGVESPEELASELEPGEKGWGDVGRWEATRRRRAVARAALTVDEAHRLIEA